MKNLKLKNAGTVTQSVAKSLHNFLARSFVVQILRYTLDDILYPFFILNFSFLIHRKFPSEVGLV